MPEAPRTLVLEDFENNPQANTVGLAQYTGSDGQTYTAESPWLDQAQCNGIVLTYQQDPTACAGDDNNQAQNNIRRLADVLGQVGAGVTGGSDAAPVNGSTASTQANHALSEFTLTQDPAANSVEFESNGPLYTAPTSRFVTFQADVAELSCVGYQNSLLNFYLSTNGQELPTQSAPIRACTDASTTSYTSPAPAGGYGSGGSFARAGSFSANGSQLVTAGQQLGVVLRNATGSSAGNDHAIDNIRLLDATPKLDKAFSPTSVETNGTSTLTFTVTNTSELAAKNGWSFTDTFPAALTIANQNVGGTCDADTAVTTGGNTVAVTNGNLTAGETSCTITVQVTSATAGTYTNGPENVTTVGLDPPGDSTVTFTDPSFSVAKTANVDAAIPGQTVTYSVTVANTGTWAYDDNAPDPFKRASFTDDLSGVTDDATYVPGSATDGATVSDDGQTLSWSGTLAVGQTRTISYQVTVNSPDTGDKELRNAVTGGPTCQGDCTPSTVTRVRTFTVTKTVNTEAVTPGDRITYTVTVANTGTAAITDDNPASFTDDLSAVVDDATFNNDATASAGSTQYAAPTLTWTGPVAVGATVTVTYSVTVNTPDTGDKRIRNAVTGGAGCEGECTPSTDTPVRTFAITKQASKAAANPGDTVTYTVTVTNTGTAPFTAADPATFTDDLSKVLDDAQYNRNAAATTGTVTYERPTLSWAGPIEVGDTATITYAVTVDTPDTGDQELRNAVAGGPGCEGTCDPSTITPVRSFTVTKQASAATAAPGSTVAYTVTITNTGKADYTADVPASFTDNLSKVLDDASYNRDGKATAGTVSYTAPKLAWNGPVAVGENVTVTYSVTVNRPDAGDRRLVNVVVPTGPGGQCVAGQCSTVTDVPPGFAVHTGGAATVFTSGRWAGLIAAGLAVLAGLSAVMYRRRGDRVE